LNACLATHLLHVELGERMPAEILSELGLGFGVSLVMGAFMAVTTRHKALSRKDTEAASVPRLFVAYFLGTAAGFASIRGLEGVWRHVAMVVIASPVLAITLTGDKPLLSRAYAENVAMAAGVCLSLWAVLSLWVAFGMGTEGLGWFTSPRVWRW
jgi:hypothetical protein